MNVFFYGQGHLRDSLACAARLRGMTLTSPAGEFISDLMIIADDVTDHSDPLQLAAAELSLGQALEQRANEDVPVVVVSQVPPGWTRAHVDGAYWQEHENAEKIGISAGTNMNIFYQVDTIIVDRAVERAARPEQFIVGCADPAAPLPLAYQEYLAAHGPCPVRRMSYESAELTKCAINYVLSKQIEAARQIARAAQSFGADYADVERAVRGDARIGPHAYLRPGEINQHLKRDVDTIDRVKIPE